MLGSPDAACVEKSAHDVETVHEAGSFNTEKINKTKSSPSYTCRHPIPKANFREMFINLGLIATPIPDPHTDYS